MVGEKVLQGVAANAVLALLLDHVVVDGQQLGGYGAVQHVIEGGFEHRVLRGAGDVRHRGANLGFRHADVHIVHGGVVTVVGAPPVNILRQILRAHIQTVDLVGNVHQDHGAHSRLGIFKGDGVIVMGVADVVKVLIYTLADVNHAHFASPLLCHHHGVALGAAGGTEAGHGHGDHVLAGQAHPPDGQGTDHHGQGGVHPAGDAHHAVVQRGVFHPLHKAGYLHVDLPLAIGGQILLLFRQVWVPQIGPRQVCFIELAAPNYAIVGFAPAVKAASGSSHVQHGAHVNLRHGERSAVLVFCQHSAVFRHCAQAGIHIVGGGLTSARRRENHPAG